VNDEIARLRDSSAFGEYMCECGPKTCAVAITISSEEFEAIRRESGCFVVRHGRRLREDDRVVEENHRYRVVEKTGAAGVLMEHVPAHGAE